jgi:hypothetical protein
LSPADRTDHLIYQTLLNHGTQFAIGQKLFPHTLTGRPEARKQTEGVIKRFLVFGLPVSFFWI